MKGLIRKAAAALCCVAGAGGVGCVTYHDLVDPCYPARYDAEARHEEVASYTPQIANGHVLDQTLWNSDFEAGTDKLTGGGMEHLAYMARRRPQPDPVVYLETAHDVYYDPAKPNDMADKRADLDARRCGGAELPVGPDGRTPRRLPGAGPRPGRGRRDRRLRGPRVRSDDRPRGRRPADRLVGRLAHRRRRAAAVTQG